MRKLKIFLLAATMMFSVVSCNGNEKNGNIPLDEKPAESPATMNISVPTGQYCADKYYIAPDNVTIREVLSVSIENVIYNGYIESGFADFEVLGNGNENFPVAVLDDDTTDVLIAGDNILTASGPEKLFLKDYDGNIISSNLNGNGYREASVLPGGKIAVASTDSIKIYNSKLECETVIDRNDFSPEEMIYDICADSKGNIYCFTWNKIYKDGSIYSLKESGKAVTVKDTLADLGDNITDIFTDKDDNLIICSFDNGTCLFDVIDSSTGEILILENIENVLKVYGCTSENGIIYSNNEGLNKYDISSGTSQLLVSSSEYRLKEIFDVVISENNVSLIVGTYTNHEICMIVSDHNGEIIHTYPTSEQLIYTFRDDYVYFIDEIFDSKTTANRYISIAGADISPENSRLFEITNVAPEAFIASLAVDNKGNFILLASDEEYYFYIYSKNGEFLGKHKINTDDYIRKLIYDKDNNILATGDDSVYKINDDFTLSSTGFAGNSLNYSSAYDGYDFIYRTDTSLYGYSVDTGVYEGIFSWNDIITADMEYLDLPQSLFTDSSGIYYNNIMTKTIYKASKTTENTNLKTIKLSLSAFENTEESIKKAVRNFNNENSEYHIQLVDFSLESPDTSTIAYGDIPDIMMIGYNDSTMSYLCKDAFADIDTFIENDSETDAYYENILDAFRFKGKLYCMPVTYSFDTLVSNNKALAEEPIRFFDTVTDNSEMMLINTNGSSMAENLLYSYIIRNVDFENATCNFDTDEFVSLLNFIKTHVPLLSYEEDIPEELHSENIPFADTYGIYDISDSLNRYPTGTEICSYPYFNGYIDPEAVFAISEKSEYKEAAWDFIKYYMSFCVENNLNENHINIDFNKQIAENVEKDPEIQNYYPVTDETKERYNKLFEGTWKNKNAYIDIYNILNEECFYCFEGDTLAKETASSIQSKVSLYMSEIS